MLLGLFFRDFLGATLALTRFARHFVAHGTRFARFGSGYRFTETVRLCKPSEAQVMQSAPASGLDFARYAHGACFARFAYMLRAGAVAYRLSPKRAGLRLLRIAH